VIGKIIFILLILLAGGYIGYTVFINKKSGKKARR